MYGTKRIQYHLKSIIAATNTMQKIPTNANKKNGNICATVHTARYMYLDIGTMDLYLR
jgi:hypothetical protein